MELMAKEPSVCSHTHTPRYPRTTLSLRSACNMRNMAWNRTVYVLYCFVPWICRALMYLQGWINLSMGEAEKRLRKG